MRRLHCGCVRKQRRKLGAVLGRKGEGRAEGEREIVCVREREREIKADIDDNGVGPCVPHVASSAGDERTKKYSSFRR